MQIDTKAPEIPCKSRHGKVKHSIYQPRIPDDVQRCEQLGHVVDACFPPQKYHITHL